jgi:hypothetical protein
MADRNYRPFTSDETDAILAGLAAKTRIADIARHIGRSDGSVRARMRTLGLYKCPSDRRTPSSKMPGEHAEPERVNSVWLDRATVLRGDKAFKTAMIEAVKSGMERAVFGVVRSTRMSARRALRMSPIPFMSVYGSPAQMCAEIAPGSF